MLSEASPIRPRKSTTYRGSTPKRAFTSATPKRCSFMVSRMVVCAVTSWHRSLSLVTSTTSQPAASKRRARVPRMSSASYPCSRMVGMLNASISRWM